MKAYVVIDLDGTLADNRHRLGVNDWDEYDKLADRDLVNEAVLGLLTRWQASGGTVIILSSRNERHVEKTRRWLKINLIEPDHLFLRPDKDFRQDGEVKLSLLDKYFESREIALANVEFIVDDNERVIDTFKHAGFAVLQVI